MTQQHKSILKNLLGEVYGKPCTLEVTFPVSQAILESLPNPPGASQSSGNPLMMIMPVPVLKKSLQIGPQA